MNYFISVKATLVMFFEFVYAFFLPITFHSDFLLLWVSGSSFTQQIACVLIIFSSTFLDDGFILTNVPPYLCKMH